MQALVVTIQIKPEHKEAFMKSMLEDAYGSVTNEPGCLRFDVVEDAEDPQPHPPVRGLQGPGGHRSPPPGPPLPQVAGDGQGLARRRRHPQVRVDGLPAGLRMEEAVGLVAGLHRG